MYKKFFLVLDKVSSPSKFGYGISSIWRGCSLNFLIKTIFLRIFPKNHIIENEKSNEILFSSARSAIAAVLNANKIGENDEVIVCSFTCDAVIHAILSTKAIPVYADINSDLSMNELSIKKAITSKTKAIIVQNTFGRIGLCEDFIKDCKDIDILMIEDNCLSVGSKLNNLTLGQICPISIWSLEVSKSITIGWGGVLQINDQEILNRYNNYCRTIRKISLFSDLRRIIQLFISLLFYRFPTRISFLIWYFLYGFNLFRRSSDENNIIKKEIKLMGKLSSFLYRSIKPKLKKIFEKANFNYNFIDSYAKDQGIRPVIDIKSNEFIVSPRFSFYAELEDHEIIFKLAKISNIELTRWFSDVPPSYSKSLCRIVENSNAKDISKKIINIPIYWTFNKKELTKISEFLKCISQYTIK